MTLDATLLTRLSEWRPDRDGRLIFSHQDDETGATVHLTVDRQESLSCHLWEASVTRSAASLARESTIADWARRVAARVTGLLEPLHLLEADEGRGQALLRSTQPARKSDDLYYYEVLLARNGEATVRRFRGSKQPLQREQVGFTLTHEATAKLMNDLAANP